VGSPAEQSNLFYPMEQVEVQGAAAVLWQRDLMLAVDRYENAILTAYWENEKLNQRSSMDSAETTSHSPARYRSSSLHVKIQRDKRERKGCVTKESQF
jgi:hypothetical protein